jgi:hypothetical protein
MTISRSKDNHLTVEEWDEMIALKNAMNYNISQVHPDKMELFTAFFVQSLDGKGDVPLSKLSQTP